MGLRLVKKTVNQDDPTVYHLFFRRREGRRRLRPHLLRVPGRAEGARRRRRGQPDRLAGRLGGGARLLGQATCRQRHHRRARRELTHDQLRRPRGPGPRAAGRRRPRPAADRRPPGGPGRAGAAGLPRGARLLRRAGLRAAPCSKALEFEPTDEGGGGWEARGSQRGGLYPLRRAAARAGAAGRRVRPPRRLGLDDRRARGSGGKGRSREGPIRRR